MFHFSRLVFCCLCVVVTHSLLDCYSVTLFFFPLLVGRRRQHDIFDEQEVEMPAFKNTPRIQEHVTHLQPTFWYMILTLPFVLPHKLASLFWHKLTKMPRFVQKLAFLLRETTQHSVARIALTFCCRLGRIVVTTAMFLLFSSLSFAAILSARHSFALPWYYLTIITDIMSYPTQSLLHNKTRKPPFPASPSESLILFLLLKTLSCRSLWLMFLSPHIHCVFCVSLSLSDSFSRVHVSLATHQLHQHFLSCVSHIHSLVCSLLLIESRFDFRPKWHSRMMTVITSGS